MIVATPIDRLAVAQDAGPITRSEPKYKGNLCDYRRGVDGVKSPPSQRRDVRCAEKGTMRRRGRPHRTHEHA
jgi:hypothetical protein